jgi:fluoroacetyl-CoA thioesterase
MRDALHPGITNESRHTVTKDMSAPHLPRVVLATPTMVGLIEGTCLMATKPYLDDNETTVGTHVCVSHQAAALEGEEIVIRCRLTDVTKRRLTFDVSVDTANARISEGTHQRAVVSLDRMRS